jgi:hypothetical protein
VLRVEFSGGNPAPRAEGEWPLPGRSNYLIGNDPQKWLTGVPHYARVRYQEVFPGVDLLYYAKDQQLEYDFIIRPGTDPGSIRMAVKGAQEIQPSDSGGLALRTTAGKVWLHKPLAYQQGPDGEREVACNYFIDQDEIRFALGDYDPSQVLRIDPLLSYSARLDATLSDITVDASGNAYLAGVTQSANFPTTPGAMQSTFAGVDDVLIAKLDPTGSALLFATYIGGKDYDSAASIALDSSGNVIVVGSTSSSDFPVNRALQPSLLGERDAFLIKLDPAGTQLLYSTYLGGTGSDAAAAVALDANGRAVVAGYTNFSNFPTSTGALQVVYGGNRDAFVAKLDTTQSGSASLVFSTYLGGSGADEASAIAVDAAGFAFVTGTTASTNFPTASPFQAACASCAKDSDAFVSKLSPDGSSLVYSTFLGGSSPDIGKAVAVDSTANAYIAGETQSSNFPISTGAFHATRQGLVDGFVTKLNAAGSALAYSTFIGGSEYDTVAGIALDASGNAVVSGYSYSADFPTVKPVQGFVGALCTDGWGGTYPCSDAFVSKIDASGSSLIFSTLLAGASDDSAAGVSIDAADSIYIVGTAGDAFPFTPGALHMSGTGFAAKITPVKGTQPTATLLSSSPNPSNPGQAVTFTATVTPASATGLVSVRDGNAIVGFAPLSASGVASFSFGSFSGGSHSLSAEYPGDSKFAGSSSAAFIHVVNSISLTATQTSATVGKGARAAFPLSVTQTGALSSAIALSCSGLPTGWSCAFNPATVPAGSGPTKVTLTVEPGSASAQNLPHAPLDRPGPPTAICLGVVALLAPWARLTARRRKAAFVGATALGLLLLAAGCGSGSSPIPPPQGQTPPPVTFNFTVSATSESATASLPLSITVR